MDDFFKYIFYQLKNNDTIQLNAEITAQETLWTIYKVFFLIFILFNQIKKKIEDGFNVDYTSHKTYIH